MMNDEVKKGRAEARKRGRAEARKKRELGCRDHGAEIERVRR
jgi:hypothetical protein